MVHISFSDPGMHPRSVQAETLEGALETVRQEVSHYTEAFLTDDTTGRPVARASREVGETTWDIKVIKPRA